MSIQNHKIKNIGSILASHLKNNTTSTLTKVSGTYSVQAGTVAE
jgi:hypothetical protein